MDIAQRARLVLKLIYIFAALIFIGLPAAAYLFYQSNTYPDSALQMDTYPYPDFQAACETSKTGQTGGANKLTTPKGFPFNVKTPSNYQATFAHPLLIVYAPSVSRTLMEKYTGLTQQATKAGLIVAYVDGQRLSLDSIPELGKVPEEVSKYWCIDQNRIFLTGHSDGGTVSSALAFMDASPFQPTAIAPSAAGITGDELQQYQCPPPLSVMIMHNEGDSHFPEFGKQTAKWWAACNQCAPTTQATSDGNCLRYDNCAGGVETLYCEGKDGSHISWPHLNPEMIDFFLRSPSKT